MGVSGGALRALYANVGAWPSGVWHGASSGRAQQVHRCTHCLCCVGRAESSNICFQICLNVGSSVILKACSNYVLCACGYCMLSRWQHAVGTRSAVHDVLRFVCNNSHYANSVVADSMCMCFNMPYDKWRFYTSCLERCRNGVGTAWGLFQV
jgi:hypothetical protein